MAVSRSSVPCDIDKNARPGRALAPPRPATAYAIMTKNTTTENDSGRARSKVIAERVRSDGNPDELGSDINPPLFSAAKRSEMPWRDPEKLDTALDNHETVTAAAESLDTRKETVSKWAAVFGLREKMTERNASLTAHIRENVSPEDLGLDPMPEPEGST